jgi:murein L,D-transpeptidase YafK
MWFVRLLLMVTVAFGIAACGSSASKFRTYKGPEVTSIQVHKGARRMYLMHNEKVLKTYKVALGFAPEGHKEFEGDGKTPEGAYVIDRRNPRSNFHLSLGISYPNAQDRAKAEEMGKRPGGDIFIHGRSHYKGRNKGDWTEGCIAVKDREMEDIYAMVKTGTVIYILP